jgi:hypothetical protein
MKTAPPPPSLEMQREIHTRLTASPPAPPTSADDVLAMVNELVGADAKAPEETGTITAGSAADAEAAATLAAPDAAPGIETGEVNDDDPDLADISDDVDDAELIEEPAGPTRVIPPPLPPGLKDTVAFDWGDVPHGTDNVSPTLSDGKSGSTLSSETSLAIQDKLKTKTGIELSNASDLPIEVLRILGQMLLYVCWTTDETKLKPALVAFLTGIKRGEHADHLNSLETKALEGMFFRELSRKNRDLAHSLRRNKDGKSPPPIPKR